MAETLCAVGEGRTCPSSTQILEKRPIDSGQIIATSHDLGPQKVANRKGHGTPYFREI